jgi:hypothetical protein
MPGMRKALVVAGLVAITVRLGVAAPGTTSFHTVIGFTADGKAAYFEKISASLEQEDNWLVVFDGVTGKQKSSEQVIHRCTPACKDKPITRADGNKIRDATYAALGKPLVNEAVGPESKTIDDPTSSTRGGYVQTFQGKDFRIQTTMTYDGKALPDPTKTKSATFSLELKLTAGTETWTVKTRADISPSEDLKDNTPAWRSLGVTHLAVASDRHAVALVFGGKPFVLVGPNK